MTFDAFEVLQLPRHSWLDEERVREQFQKLAAEAHPDGGHGSESRFVALNEAWQILRSPTARLRHYLELTSPGVLASREPAAPTNADLFMEIAEAQQRATAVAAKLADAKSPLSRAVLEPERLTSRQQLEALHVKVAEETALLHGRIKDANATAAELGNVLKQLVFLEKWSAQLRERLVGLN